MSETATRQPATPISSEVILARLERLPVSWWHIRTRLILGTATFFDAFDLLAIAYALPILVGEWHLTPAQIGPIISAAFLGQLLGALIAGWAAERFGRLHVTTITIALFGIMSLACAWAWDPHSLMVFRFIQGVGLGGEVPIATTYINEIARAQGRGRFYIVYELVFSFGLVCAGLVGYWMVPLLGWQSMFYLGATPTVLALLLQRLLPESPRWLALTGRLDEADRAVAQIERSVTASGRELPPLRVLPVLENQRDPGGWTEMFRGIYLRRTLSVWAFWFCCFSTMYGLVSWLPTLFRTVYHLPVSASLAYGLITSLTGICGSALCAYLIDKVGRRPWFTIAPLAGGAALLVLGIHEPGSARMLLTFVAIATFFMSSVAIGLNLYTAELYPTRIRAFASSVGGAWQRVAAASGPIVVGYLLSGNNLRAVFLYFGGIAVIGGVLAYFYAVETKSRRLEEISP
jgi:MFS transporter, putative metabolite:H+ symporter